MTQEEADQALREIQEAQKVYGRADHVELRPDLFRLLVDASANPRAVPLRLLYCPVTTNPNLGQPFRLVFADHPDWGPVGQER